MSTPYRILGVRRDATPEQIKAAYRARAKKLHPDHGGDKEKFQELLHAYQTLSDPVKRKQYETSKQAPRPARSAPSTRPQYRPDFQSPHPGTPPPSQASVNEMLRQLGLIGISLVMPPVAAKPPGPVRDRLEQLSQEAAASLDSFINSFTGSRRK